MFDKITLRQIRKCISNLSNDDYKDLRKDLIANSTVFYFKRSEKDGKMTDDEYKYMELPEVYLKDLRKVKELVKLID